MLQTQNLAKKIHSNPEPSHETFLRFHEISSGLQAKNDLSRPRLFITYFGGHRNDIFSPYRKCPNVSASITYTIQKKSRRIMQIVFFVNDAAVVRKSLTYYHNRFVSQLQLLFFLYSTCSIQNTYYCSISKYCYNAHVMFFNVQRKYDFCFCSIIHRFFSRQYMGYET